MKLDEHGMWWIRRRALRLLKANVPFTASSPQYKEIVSSTGWAKTPTSGTTCGFLCHWLLHKLGCTEADRMNRADGGMGLKYENGGNISILFIGLKATRAVRNGGSFSWNAAGPFVRVAEPYAKPSAKNPYFNALEQAIATGVGGPKAGDIVFIRDPGGSNLSEHVFVFMSAEKGADGIYWNTAEAGQANGTDGDLKRRKIMPSGATDGYTRIDGNTPIRTVIGWLDLSKLDWAPNAVEMSSIEEIGY